MSEETYKEITDFYEKYYDKLVKFTCNAKKGGKDKLTMEKEDAEDLIGDLFLEHYKHPDGFEGGKWIWNRLICRRIDFFRKQTREKIALAKYKKWYVDITEGDGIYYIPYDTGDDAMKEAIKSEIMAVDDMVKREVLMRHYIMGEGVRDSVKLIDGSSHKMITRFRDKMVKKYGDVHK